MAEPTLKALADELSKLTGRCDALQARVDGSWTDKRYEVEKNPKDGKWYFATGASNFKHFGGGPFESKEEAEKAAHKATSRY